MIQILWPANQNFIQRTGFALTLISIVILVFLHNPFDGYRTQKLTSRTDWKEKSCAEEDRQKMRKLVNKQDQESTFQYQDLFRKCIEVTESSEFEEIPFEDWSSEKPHVFWLGSVLHLLEAIVVSGIIGFIWLFAFVTPKSAKENGD